MGNCFSLSKKEKRLRDIEEKYAATSSLLAARERELCDLQNQSQEVAKDASNLHANGKRLENELVSLSRKHQEEVDGLKTDLRQREEDGAARDRILESIRGEGDEQRRELDNAKQQLEQLADEKRELDDLLTKTREHTSALLVSKDRQLEDAREEISSLETTRDNIVNEKSGLLSRLVTATKECQELKKTSEKELADQKARADQQLNSVRNEGQKQVAKAKARAETMIEQANAFVQASSSTVRTHTDLLPGTFTNATYSPPVAFSDSEKDLRIEVCEYQHEVRVDIREWYGSRRSAKVEDIPQT